MSLKRNVYEFCPKCGERDARDDGDYVWWCLHQCPQAAPGPVAPPRRSPKTSVIFISGIKPMIAGLDKLIEQLAREAVCPLSHEPSTVTEKNLVRTFTEFGMKVASALAEQLVKKDKQ